MTKKKDRFNDESGIRTHKILYVPCELSKLYFYNSQDGVAPSYKIIS
jgi:hypothetical protein